MCNKLIEESRWWIVDICTQWIGTYCSARTTSSTPDHQVFQREAIYTSYMIDDCTFIDEWMPYITVHNIQSWREGGDDMMITTMQSNKITKVATIWNMRHDMTWDEMKSYQKPKKSGDVHSISHAALHILNKRKGRSDAKGNELILVRFQKSTVGALWGFGKCRYIEQPNNY